MALLAAPRSVPPCRPRWPLVPFLQVLLSEAQRAAEAERRYQQLRAASAHEGAGAHKDVARRVFEEFYA